MGLTRKEIENAKPNGKSYKLADLYLLVSRVGGKLWRWPYRFGGKEKMMALGEHPMVSIKEALERHFEAPQGSCGRCRSDG